MTRVHFTQPCAMLFLKSKHLTYVDLTEKFREKFPGNFTEKNSKKFFYNLLGDIQPDI